MAETQFESSIKTIASNVDNVYAKISDLNSLEHMKERMPSDKISDFTFDQDTVSFNMPPIGNITLRIVEREPGKCVKFKTEKSPIPFNLWIQVLPADDAESKMKLTARMELNPFIKGMVSKPIQEGIEKIADMMAMIDYD